MPVRLSSLLLEVKSSWQGQPFSRLTRDVNLYEPRSAPDDETIADVFARVRTLLLRLVATRLGEVVVCVTHADPIMILRVGMQNLDLTLPNIRGKDYPAKGSVTEFRFAQGSLRPEISYVDVGALDGAATQR